MQDMKVDRLETHDRLLHFKKDQALSISQGVEDCLKKSNLALLLQDKSPYIYIFAHPRTADDGFTKRMLYQPRLSKPESQTNSYLFRVKSKTDLIEVCWLLPPEEMWGQYEKGKVTESDVVLWSINEFRFNKKQLDMPHPEDLSEDVGRVIYKEVLNTLKPNKFEKLKPMTLEESSSSSAKPL